MTISTLSGPLVSVGQPPAISGMPGDYNSDLGPSLFWGGTGILDPRGTNQGSGSAASPMFYGFLGSTRIPLINQVPSAITAANIAASQTPTTGTTLTLVTSTAAGITVLSSATVVPPSFTSLAAGTLAIDSASGVVTYGTSTAVQLYDPTKAIARNVRITSDGNDSASGKALVAGNDIYGYAMSELISLSNASVASGAKAFKFIRSITLSGTINSANMSAGTGDVIGFPMRTDTFSQVQIYYAATNATLITSATGFTAAVTTDPATTTTGDVRGTYALQTASNASIRLLVYGQPTVANLGTATGMFGIAQV